MKTKSRMSKMTVDRPYRVEYARSGRAECKICNELIAKDSVRIAVAVQNRWHDSKTFNWHHAECFFKRYLPQRTGEIDNFDSIRWEDQEYIKKKISISETTAEAMESTSSNSSERKRSNVAISTLSCYTVKYIESDHSNCCGCGKPIKEGEVGLSKRNWGSEKAHSSNCLNRWHHIQCFVKLRLELQFFDKGTDIPGFSTLSEEDQDVLTKALPKIPEEDVPETKKLKTEAELSGEEKDLKDQQDNLFNIRDKLSLLKKNEWIEMLKANSLRVPSGNSQILDNLADALLFGALEPCPQCGGTLEFKSETGYKCDGYVSAWVSCENITQDPERKTFAIPEHLKEKLPFLDSFQPKVRRRILKVVAPSNAGVTDGPNIQGIKQTLEKQGSFRDSSKSGFRKVKLHMKGGSAVDPDSRLVGTAHVYQRGKDKFTVTLGNTELQMNKNSYYKLQILKHDKEEKYWLFRSWGRIGTKIGSNKCDNMTLEECIQKFENLFEERTGNKWSNRDFFAKKRNKMYLMRCDTDQDNDKSTTNLLKSNIESKLKKPVQDLMRLIFDVSLMKKAMLEYEIDVEKMPLGKISKRQIREAYFVLTRLLELIENTVPNRDKVIEESNKFYTLIPHNFGLNRPKTIETVEAIQKKQEMLESLLEMEFAYKLIDTETKAMLNPLDALYEHLNTSINVLDRESDEFKLIEKYVNNTHSEVHDKYKLIVEEVFIAKRSGEESRYEPFKKLPNRKLLWHGSRTTNFAGILSQGLRIAPPEAPCSGYMFGKGIYFADMVSKSANYCHAEPPNSTGLLLLCEVALGNMYERFKGDYIEKLPDGYHSTWGRGKIQPDPKQFVKLENGVEVPCGPGIPTNIGQEFPLIHNEFIVYDVAQVKVEYIIKMNFEFKENSNNVCLQ